MRCRWCGKREIGGPVGFEEYSACDDKKCQRFETIRKIENNDPETLGKIADLILMQEGSPVLPEVKCTTKELNKMIRDEVGKK